MNYRDADQLTDSEVINHYLDWRDDMANAFNGAPYPKQYPRGEVYSVLCCGKLLTFYNLELYLCNRFNISIEELRDKARAEK